jgi:GDP-L-fucose synthase
MLTNSLLISLNMLNAAQANGVKEYLYVSSSCVYPQMDSMDHMEEPMAEFGWPETANEGYGWAKRIGERQAQYYARENPRLRIVIARPANIYGPSYDWKTYNPHVIPSLILQMLQKKDHIVVWGSGNQTRTFMHERDVAQLIVNLMEKGKSGEAYNLGGTEIQIRHLVTGLADICKFKGKISFDTSRPEGPVRKAYDTQKLEPLIKRPPEIPITEGLRETVEAARKFLGNGGSNERVPLVRGDGC